MTGAVDPVIVNVTVFVLAVFVGYHVVWNVTPALHTPLMSVTNAISSVIMVGAILAAGAGTPGPGGILGAIAVAPRRHQHLRRLHGHPPHARDVPEEGRGAPQVAERCRPTRSRSPTSSPASSSSWRSRICRIRAPPGAATCSASSAWRWRWRRRSRSRGGSTSPLGMMAAGGVIGIIIAKRVQMTQMPELVAAMHSLVGLAAVMIAVAILNDPLAFNVVYPIPRGNRVELFIGTVVGAITFSGSVIAFGKLAGLGRYGRDVLERAGHVSGAALDQPRACAGDDLLRRPVRERNPRRSSGRRSSYMTGIGVPARRPDHHSDRRRRHAGRDLDAEQLFRMGRRRHRLLAQQLDAHHRRIAGGIVGRDPVLHHVPRDEPVVLQRHPRGLRRRRGHRRQGGGAEDGQVRARPKTSPSCSATPRASSSSPATGLPSAARSTRSRRWRDKLTAKGRERAVRHSPGRGPDAGPHERAARRGRGALRPGRRDGRHQQRLRLDRRRVRARRQRRREPAGRAARQSHLRHADSRSAQGTDRAGQQAIDGGRLRRHRQSRSSTWTER